MICVLSDSQGRDMRVCLWDLAEGRGDVTDALWTGSVGFCRCSLLETGPGRWLLAHAGEAMEEVREGGEVGEREVCGRA